MTGIIRDFFEAVLFLLLTSFFYFVFIVTIPVFKDPHGLLAMIELADLSRSGYIKTILFSSAGVFSLMGVLMVAWAPIFTPGIMANLWASTYFFTWIDTILILSIQSHSLHFFTAFGIGIAFIYVFFLVLNTMGSQIQGPEKVSTWKSKAVHVWVWGSAGFYLGLSGLLMLRSFNYDGFHLALAFGAMIVCFLNYLLGLFLAKEEGKKIEKVSFAGRVVFSIWLSSLAIVWILQKGIG